MPSSSENRQAGAEIEITSEMIEAGVKIFDAWEARYNWTDSDGYLCTERDLVQLILKAALRQHRLALDPTPERALAAKIQTV